MIAVRFTLENQPRVPGLCLCWEQIRVFPFGPDRSLFFSIKSVTVSRKWKEVKLLNLWLKPGCFLPCRYRFSPVSGTTDLFNPAVRHPPGSARTQTQHSVKEVFIILGVWNAVWCQRAKAPPPVMLAQIADSPVSASQSWRVDSRHLVHFNRIIYSPHSHSWLFVV